MKGLRDLADGYIYSEEEDASDREENGVQVEDETAQSIDTHSRPSPAILSTPSSSSNTSSVISRSSTQQDPLVQAVDVPSGWIHLQSTYLDGTGGQRKVRSFGLRNLVEKEVKVEVGSDLGGQLVFWIGDDDRREWNIQTKQTSGR